MLPDSKVGKSSVFVGVLFCFTGGIVLACSGDQFEDVCRTIHIDFIRFFPPQRQIIDVRNQAFNERSHSTIGGLLVQLLDQIDKTVHRLATATGESIDRARFARRFKQTHAILLGMIAEFQQRRIANSSSWPIDDTFHRGVVGMVFNQTQISNKIAHFCTFVK